MEKNDFIPGLIWMGLGIAIAIESFSLKLGRLNEPGPGLLPFILGIGLSIFSLPVLFSSLKIIIIGDKKNKVGMWSEVNFKKLILVLVSLLGYSLLLEKVGYLLTGFVVLLILFYTVESQKHTTAIILSFVTIIATYILFVIILKVELPSGLLRIR